MNVENKKSPSIDKAQKLIESAENAILELEKRALAEVQEMADNAREQGLTEGASEAEHMYAEIQTLEQRMFNELQSEAIRSALTIARELVQKEFKIRPEAMVDLAVNALRSSQDAREVFLRVHPDTISLLKKNENRLLNVMTVAPRVDIRMDKKVTFGGVIVQTESGVIDADIDTQLQEIARILGA